MVGRLVLKKVATTDASSADHLVDHSADYLVFLRAYEMVGHLVVLKAYQTVDH